MRPWFISAIAVVPFAFLLTDQFDLDQWQWWAFLGAAFWWRIVGPTAEGEKRT